MINIYNRIQNVYKELFPHPQFENKHFRYFVSFVEEMIMNDNWPGYVGGRCEVFIDEEQWNIHEYRFFTNKKSFYKFRNFVDFNHYNIIGLWLIKTILYYYYNDRRAINKFYKRLDAIIKPI